MSFKAYIESNKEGNTLPDDAEKYIFPFGTLDGFFKQKKSNL